MKLTHLANQRIIISRLTPVTGTTNRFALATVTAAIVNLQALDAQAAMVISGVPGKTYRIFCDTDIDIQENDQLKDEDGTIYIVRKGGGTRWRHGAMDFQEVYITQKS